MVQFELPKSLTRKVGKDKADLRLRVMATLAIGMPKVEPGAGNRAFRVCSTHDPVDDPHRFAWPPEAVEVA